MKKSVKVSDIIKPIDEVPVQAYLSNAIQVADVLEYMLYFSGPAEVMMSTFSISEEFLRRLFFIRKRANISRFDLVMDFKGTQKTLLLWPFIKQTIENCHLADNHSKMIIVSGKSFSCALVTSQNLTRGNRYESGVVISDPDLVGELRSDLRLLIDTKSVPFNELFDRTVKND